MPNDRQPDDIQFRMKKLRGSLDSNVERVASSVRTKTDWRYYVREHPWLSVASAAAVGFLVVPRRVVEVQTYIPDPDTLKSLAKKEKLVVAPPKQKRTSENSFASKLTAIALAAGVRAASGYVQGLVSQETANKGTRDADAPPSNTRFRSNDETASMSAQRSTTRR